MTRNLSSTPQAGPYYTTCNIEFTMLFMPLPGTLGQDEIHHDQVWRPRTSVATVLAGQKQAAAA